MAGHFPTRRIDEKPLSIDLSLGSASPVSATAGMHPPQCNPKRRLRSNNHWNGRQPGMGACQGTGRHSGKVRFRWVRKSPGNNLDHRGANPPLNVTPGVITGTYTISRDCTGSLMLNFSPAPNGHYNLIASPDGRRISMISADLGDVLVATASRLARRDGD